MGFYSLFKTLQQNRSVDIVEKRFKLRSFLENRVRKLIPQSSEIAKGGVRLKEISSIDAVNNNVFEDIYKKEWL